MKLVVAGLVMLLAAAVGADEDAVAKYRDYLPNQIAALPEDERRSTVPIMYSMAAGKALSVGSDLVFMMELNSLMYPGIGNYEGATKAFQTDLGDEPNGRLTVWQIDKLERYAEMQRASSIIFPSKFYGTMHENVAKVEGTITILDDRIADPINQVEITCYKQDEYCSFRQLSLITPKDDGWGYSFHVYQGSPETYVITRWDETSIDAVPYDPGSGCRTTALNLNFKTNEFFQITKNGGGDCSITNDVEFPKLDRPRIAQIVDGERIVAEEFQRLKAAAFEVLSSDFRRQIKEIQDKEATSDKKP